MQRIKRWGGVCGSADQNRQRKVGEFDGKEQQVNKPYPGKALVCALGKSPMGMSARVTLHPKRWSDVCVGRAIEPRNPLFAGGDTVAAVGESPLRSQHGSDEGPTRRGRWSSARARKVCCTRIGRSLSVRSCALVAAVLLAD